VINKKQVMTGNVGTVAWTAPEVFDGRRYNEKADVYSFGMYESSVILLTAIQFLDSIGIILWELCTREVPFVNLSSFAIPVLVIKGKRPDVPKFVKPKFKKLINLCWNQKPKARPDMNKMIDSLKKLHQSLQPEEKVSIRRSNFLSTSVLTNES
jgi:serine/threonine protein kinase